MAKKTVREKLRDQNMTAGEGFKPSRVISGEAMEALAEGVDARKRAVADPGHTIKQNDSWKKQQSIWPNATEEERMNYLYEMVMWHGVVMQKANALQRIARFFNINVKELEPYMHILWMADEARCMKIDYNTFHTFLFSDRDTNGKFNLQNQFAYHTVSPAWEGAPASADTKEITITVKTKETESTTDESAKEDATETVDGLRIGASGIRITN